MIQFSLLALGLGIVLAFLFSGIEFACCLIAVSVISGVVAFVRGAPGWNVLLWTGSLFVLAQVGYGVGLGLTAGFGRWRSSTATESPAHGFFYSLFQRPFRE